MDTNELTPHLLRLQRCQSFIACLVSGVDWAAPLHRAAAWRGLAGLLREQPNSWAPRQQERLADTVESFGAVVRNERRATEPLCAIHDSVGLIFAARFGTHNPATFGHAERLRQRFDDRLVRRMLESGSEVAGEDLLVSRLLTAIGPEIGRSRVAPSLDPPTLLLRLIRRSSALSGTCVERNRLDLVWSVLAPLLYAPIRAHQERAATVLQLFEEQRLPKGYVHPLPPSDLVAADRLWPVVLETQSLHFRAVGPTSTAGRRCWRAKPAVRLDVLVGIAQLVNLDLDLDLDALAAGLEAVASRVADGLSEPFSPSHRAVLQPLDLPEWLVSLHPPLQTGQG